MTSIDAGTRAGPTQKTSRGASGRDPGRNPGRARDLLFRTARRHTLFVRVLRTLCPVLILAGFGYYGLILTNSFRIGPGALRFGKIEVTPDDLKMKNPSYFGVTKDSGKYEVRAKQAAVDLAMTGPVKLEGIDGDLVQVSGLKTVLRATRGSLENKKGELELFDGVEIYTSDGMKARLKSATVKTKEHYVSSREPLRADMPAGTLTANTMDYWSDKKLARFGRNITLRLTQLPATTPGAAQPSIGLGGDGRQPIDLSSIELDIDDAHALIDFRSQVVARQGETQLTAPYLRALYEGRGIADGATAVTPPVVQAAPGTAAGTGTQLTKLIGHMGVVLTAGTDRRLIADAFEFDVKADTALFNGNVELLQAKNVFRGGRLAIDRKAGRTRLDSPAIAPKTAVGRIAATLVQTADPSKPAAGSKGKGAAPAAEPAGAFSGFHSDPNAPTDIEADTLDVNEQTKQAIFRGRVIAKQGDVIIHTSELIAHYSGQTGLLSSPGGTPAIAGAKAAVTGAQLTHLDTKGGTKVIAKDGQEAEGENARFDIKANTVVMDGPKGVTLHQGPNMTQGARLRMDLTTGEAHIENPALAQAGLVAPTPGQLSITAKPGVAPPAQPSSCPPGGGQSCMIFYPEQLKVTTEGRAKGATGSPPAAPAKPKSDPVQPQLSPSSVYRSN